MPYRHARQSVEARITATTVEVFHQGQRIAAHVLNPTKGRHTTLDAHMPPQHQFVAGWSEHRLLQWAQSIGDDTYAAVQRMLNTRKHPQQSYRAVLGVLRLAKGVGNGRLNAACARALSINAANYRSIDSILKHGLDKQTPAIRAQGQLPMEHSNVRGPDYYH